MQTKMEFTPEQQVYVVFGLQMLTELRTLRPFLTGPFKKSVDSLVTDVDEAIKFANEARSTPTTEQADGTR